MPLHACDSARLGLLGHLGAWSLTCTKNPGGQSRLLSPSLSPTGCLANSGKLGVGVAGHSISHLSHHLALLPGVAA